MARSTAGDKRGTDTLAPRLAIVLDALIHEATHGDGDGITIAELHRLHELEAEGKRAPAAEIQRLRRKWLAALERFLSSLAPSERLRLEGAIHLLGDDLDRLGRGALG
jgi:hypothetical protein